MKYKVVEITKNFEDVIDEGIIDRHTEKRYIVVDEETGKILDDAQGYGYKSREKAHRGFAYKNRTPEKKKKDKEINDWINSHKKLIKRFEEICWYAFEDHETVKSSDVENLLVELNLKEECPFSSVEIFRKLNKR